MPLPRTLLQASAGVLLLAAGVPAQGLVLTVDDDGPADFPEIAQALAVAQDGDTLLVQDGTYASFAVEGKAVSIQAANAGGVVVAGPAIVRDIAAGKVMTLRGVKLGIVTGPGSLVIKDCQGLVWIEECFAGGYANLYAESCARVVLSRVDLSSIISAGLVLVQSSVHAFDSVMRGGSGSGPFGIPPSPGDPGIYAVGGFLYLSGCEVQGGQGGESGLLFGVCVGPADGGAALHLAGDSPQVFHRDTSFTGGPPGLATACGPAGDFGPPIKVETGTVQELADAARSFRVGSPAAAGQPFTLDFLGLPGDQVFLLFSLTADATFFPACSGTFVLPPLSFATAFIGTIPAAGALSIATAIPSAGLGTETVTLHAQANFVAPDITCHLSSPSALVMTQPCQGSGVDCNGNGISDDCEVLSLGGDCNGNGVPDECDIAAGSSSDCDVDGLPDECAPTFSASSPVLSPFEHKAHQGQFFEDLPEPAGPVVIEAEVFTQNSAALGQEIALYVNGVLAGTLFEGWDITCAQKAMAQLELSPAFWTANVPAGNALVSADSSSFSFSGCPETSIRLTLRYPLATDCNGNGTLDACDIASGSSTDWNANGVPDECPADGDLDHDGKSDVLEVLSGAADCNGNWVPDVFEFRVGVPSFTHGSDLCAEAPRANTGNTYVAVTTNMTNDGGPFCSGSDRPDAWYRYIPATAGTLHAETCGSLYQARVSLQASCAPGSQLVCGSPLCAFSTNYQAVLNVQAGEEYLIRLHGSAPIYDGAGLGLLTLTGPPAVDNDCNGNGVLDSCEIAAGASQDLNGNGIPDECLGG
jgi:hypothetical protein